MFGGRKFSTPLKSAYRYHFDGDYWKKLPNMNFGREMISPVLVGDEIYLFAGSFSKIDVFHTRRVSYRIARFENSERLNSSLSVASLYDDKIYLITQSYIQVYDKNLEKLFSKPL